MTSLHERFGNIHLVIKLYMFLCKNVHFFSSRVINHIFTASLDFQLLCLPCVVWFGITLYLVTVQKTIKPDVKLSIRNAHIIPRNILQRVVINEIMFLRRKKVNNCLHSGERMELCQHPSLGYLQGRHRESSPSRFWGADRPSCRLLQQSQPQIREETPRYYRPTARDVCNYPHGTKNYRWGLHHLDGFTEPQKKAIWTTSKTIESV